MAPHRDYQFTALIRRLVRLLRVLEQSSCPLVSPCLPVDSFLARIANHTVHVSLMIQNISQPKELCNLNLSASERKFLRCAQKAM
jgi:hypothetical protein